MDITVVNPAQLTGNDYEVFFDQQHYYRDLAGIWQMTNYPDSVGRVLGKITDVSPSTITGSAIASATIGTIDLIFTLDLVAPGGAWVDGVRLDLPDDLTVNSHVMTGSYGTYAGQGQNCTDNIPSGELLAGNVILWGDSARSTFGCIEGTVIFTVNVQPFTFPISVGYTVYDDGYDGTIVDAVGTITIDELGYEFKTIKHWNLKDVTTGDILLEDQTLIDGIKLERIIDGVYYSGGEEIGSQLAPILDGFQINVKANYAAPVDATKRTVTGSGSYDIDSYYASGWAGTAMSVDTYGAGITSVNYLQRDVKVVFDGVLGEADENGFVPVVEGGSDVWIYGARGYDIADHPANPNPGSSDPFLIKAPFKVYDMEAGDGPVQISSIIYDRMGDPAVTPFYAFNPADRMYTEFVHRPYEETLADFASNEAFLTWNVVWWETDWVIGDYILFQYDNPIQLGIDKFNFKTTGKSGDVDLAKVDIEKINVFPNPYYAYNPQSTDRFDRYVTFSHLPGVSLTETTIRIFNLAGIQVRKLEITDDKQYLQWDIKNEAGLPVGSGLYIALIDMPDLGKEKVLKIFIIQRKEILQYY